MGQEADGCSFMYIPSFSSVSTIHVHGFEPSSWKIFVAMLEHVISLDLRRELSSEFLSSACLLEGLRRTRTADGGCAWCRVECQVRRTCRVPTAAVSERALTGPTELFRRVKIVRASHGLSLACSGAGRNLPNPQTWPNSGGGASVRLAFTTDPRGEVVVPK